MSTARFDIGDEILFQPNVELIDGVSGRCMSSGTRAKVLNIMFDKDDKGRGKVLYTLALWMDGSFYEKRPIYGVDSYFVCPID